jgi:hypothetical protein
VQLAGILEEELRSARSVAGRDAVLTLSPRPGVEVLDTRGVPVERMDDGRVKLRIGALYAGETRTVSVKVRVPARGAEQQQLGEVGLTYTTKSGDDIERARTVRYVLTDSPDRVRDNEVPQFMVAADRMRVAHVLIDAAALLKEGDLLEAQAIMRDERARLEKRRARLDGAAMQEADALIEMFRDPYVDADLGKRATATAAATPADLDKLVDTVWKGNAVDEAALATLDADALRVLRNAPYARHGYRFKSAELRGYFAKTGWYSPDPKFDHRRLTPQDVQTVAAVKTWERRAKLVGAARPTAAPRVAVDLDALVGLAARGEALSDSDLAPLDLAELRVVRNASYARHGYRFRSADLRKHFTAEPWYSADASYDPSRLSVEDTQNVRRVKRFERQLVAGGGREALRDFQLRNRSRAHRLLP